MSDFFVGKSKIALLAIVLIGSAFAVAMLFSDRRASEQSSAMVPQNEFSPLPIQKDPVKEGEPLPPPPPPPDIDRMKRQGCVTDGLLNGDFPADGKTISLINRSDCYYLHRAVETWLSPPDWETIDENRAKLRGGLLPGMFLAEAIDTDANYEYSEEGRDFEFSEMCRPASRNFWGQDTCKPSFQREEYRKYLRQITREAMDRNVQVFLFGQIYLQDSNDLSRTAVPKIIAEMREYAGLRGMEIVIGAQTNDISDPLYLSLFDFIEGGVGIDSDGNIEGGPCHSRWWKKEGDWCWGLLWNDRFAKGARNVFLHYDWSGKVGDDMSTLTRMSKERRQETTRKLYRYFTGKDMGFLVPYLARLHVDNGGCYGPAKRFYTPDNRYKCDDEDAWEALLPDRG